MRLTVAAIGRLKKGPEQDLVKRYSDRIIKSGKAIGITQFQVLEIPESRASDSTTRKREEADTLLAKLADASVIIALDERGKSQSSRSFAADLIIDIEGPSAHIAFVIGGPDGLTETLRDQATRALSFGKLTMPHQIVRILLLEQIYRAITIQTNHPYHRD